MQQIIHPAKGPVHAKFIIPGSKSLTMRALLLAGLAEGVSELSGIRISQSTKTLINALHQVGIVTQLDEASRTCIIAGCSGKLPKKQATIWCGDSATVARFLMAASAATPGVYYFDGSEEARKHSISQLLNAISNRGIQLIPSDHREMPFTLIGADSLEGGEVHIEDDIYNQTTSPLLMIAPYARSPFIFKLENPEHHLYLDMTSAMMADFGVLVHRIHQGQFMVPVPQKYQAKDYTVEPDFGIAAYFFAAAAITNGEVTIQPTKRQYSKQLNAKFLSILEKMGCRIFETHTGLTVKGTTELQGIDVSVSHFNDTVFALAAIAPFAKSPTRIAHMGGLGDKEKHQFQHLKTELMRIGVSIESGLDWIKIFPSTPHGETIETHNDRHLAMAFAVIGLKASGIVLSNTQCVTQHYAEFFTAWEKLLEPINMSA